MLASSFNLFIKTSVSMPSIVCLVLFLAAAKAYPTNQTVCQKYADDATVEKFREYVRIDTSPRGNIYHAVEFWRRQAESLGLPFKVYEPAGKPICVITMVGSNPALPSIMLNSHMDVVTVEIEDWNHPPFAANMDSECNIYGRGTQDDKDVAIQYIEALRHFKENNIVLQRTVHMTLMPDEETGGFDGMKAFINTTEFKVLNIGFALDEGLCSVDDTLYAIYLDKRPWQMEFTCEGVGGHSSSVPETAMEKLTRLIDAVMKFRQQQKMVISSRDPLDYGSYTTININILKGGIATNIIPTHIKVVIDMRLATNVTVDEAESWVSSWLDAAGANTTVRFLRKDLVSLPTRVDDSNPFWLAMQQEAAKMQIPIKLVVRPATSDMVVLRNLDIPALGFSAKTRTISRTHGANEYLNAEVLIRGVEIYVNMLKRLANLQ